MEGVGLAGTDSEVRDRLRGGRKHMTERARERERRGVK